VTSREMKIDRRLFQIMMSQQQLYGAQVSAVFQQVGSETVPQGVRMDPILQAGVLCRLVAGMPDGLVTDGAIGGMRGAAGE